MMKKHENNYRKQITQRDLRERIANWIGTERVPNKIKIVTDISDFFKVDYDNVIILKDRPYLVRNYERKGRFGIEEEPKFWVRKAVDLTDGSIKIIKKWFFMNSSSQG